MSTGPIATLSFQQALALATVVAEHLSEVEEPLFSARGEALAAYARTLALLVSSDHRADEAV